MQVEMDYPHDPMRVFRALQGLPHAVALHSGRSDVPLARYSYFAADPCAILRLNHDGAWRTSGVPASLPQDPLDVLQSLCSGRRSCSPHAPMSGGWVGYLAYELAGYVDGLPQHRRPETRSALLWLAYYDAVAVLDHHQRRAWIAGRPPGFLSAGESATRARVEALAQRLKTVPPPTAAASAPRGALEFEQSRQYYRARIAAIKEHLRAGDIYQANYTQRVRLAGRFCAPQLFADMHRHNPAPFSAYLDCGDHQVVSASPELFLDFDGRTATTRPIKGTRPRGASPQEDARLIDALRKSPKDLAEHLMIVDLERNDLGRVCAAGSVKAEGMLAVESYASVHHLVSTVRGELPADRGAAELLRALFPGGSVTGAPKRAAMQVIAALEPCPRGVYTGCIGWLDESGRMQWNIAIRTLLVRPDEVLFHVGGGIVWDSDPEAEYEECRHKAAGLLWGLGLEA